MNILYVGPYKQKDSMGMTSQSYIKALMSNSNNNITTRPIFLNGTSSEIDQDIMSCEKSLYDYYDVVIQHTMPHCLFYDGRYKKNIAIISLETNDISNSDCIFNMNLMDEIWVASEQEKKCLTKSGVKSSIKVVSQAIDTDFIKANIGHRLNLHPLIENTFKFYFIGEYLERKNIADLVVAFNLAFEVTDPVTLVIKSNISGSSVNDSYKTIEKDIDTIKSKLNTNKRYKKEIIITDNLSYKDTIGLHNACDCFVMPSYGESFCRSAYEALVLGNTPIVTDNTGMTDYINSNNGSIIKSYRTPVVMNNRNLFSEFDIYNANEYWYKVNIYDLIDNMRSAYSMYKTDRKKWQQKKDLGKQSIDEFSYKTIGDKLCI
jgi:glycosyltransferase involved in cell wall biosynthesis